MVPRVQAGLVALGVVAPTALLARLVHMLVAAGVWPEIGEGEGGASLAFKVVGQNVCKYSSSAWVNLCVMATNRLSPEIGRGSGECMNIAGAIGGLATRYG